MSPDLEDSKYGSRKFLLALFVILLGTGLLLAGSLTPEIVDLLKWTLGLYFGFNVTQKAADWAGAKVMGL